MPDTGDRYFRQADTGTLFPKGYRHRTGHGHLQVTIFPH